MNDSVCKQCRFFGICSAQLWDDFAVAYLLKGVQNELRVGLVPMLDIDNPSSAKNSHRRSTFVAKAMNKCIIDAVGYRCPKRRAVHVTSLSFTKQARMFRLTVYFGFSGDPAGLMKTNAVTVTWDEEFLMLFEEVNDVVSV